MRRRRLGGTDVEISVVGFGAWAIGGVGNADGHLGPADDDESIAAIRRALDLGVNWIDTAPVYGLGHSEEVVARALRGMVEPPMLFTKCGFEWDGDGAVRLRLSAAAIRRELEDSLRRLGAEVIDLYQIHRVSRRDDHLIEEAITTLVELQAAGAIRHFGVSNFDLEQLERAQAVAPVASLQPPYSLLNRSSEAELLPYCAHHDVGVLAYSPMESGLLTGGMTPARLRSLPRDDLRRRNPRFVEPALSRNLGRIEQLGGLVAAWGWNAGQAAVAWVLQGEGVSGAIVGFRRPAQVDAILAGPELALTPARLRAIEAIGWT
jgi:aryl-alcohol dehydrogenase-like predicted oxidoreductase